MDRQKRLTILLAVFMIINILSNISLQGKVGLLEKEISQLRVKLDREAMNLGASIYNFKNEMSKKIDQGTSILASVEKELFFEDGQIKTAISVLPKDKHTYEKIYLSFGDAKKEMMKINTGFRQSFVIDNLEEITPIVSLESSTLTRQQVLTEINVHEFLSLDYNCAWNRFGSDKESMLNILLYARNNEIKPLLNENTEAELIIANIRNGREIARVKMVHTEMTTPEFMEMINKLEAISFEADLNDFARTEGHYLIGLEFKLENGFTYKQEQIASCSWSDSEMAGHRGAQHGILYPSMNKKESNSYEGD